MFLRPKVFILLVFIVISISLILRSYYGIEEKFKIKRYKTISFIQKLCSKTWLNTTNGFVQKFCQEDGFKVEPGGGLSSSPTISLEKLLKVSADVTKATVTTETTDMNYDNPQQCVIPKIDPFHRQAQPFISYDRHQRCTLRFVKSCVEKGILKVNLKNVRRIRLSYIKRISDELNELKSKIIYNVLNEEQQGKS